MGTVNDHPKYWNKVLSCRCDSLIPSYKLPCALSVKLMNELAMNVDTYTHTHTYKVERYSKYGHALTAERLAGRARMALSALTVDGKPLCPSQDQRGESVRVK